MPELPEVETTRRHLAAAVTGRVVVEARVGRDRTGRRNARPADVAERLRGRRVERVGRLGKFIIAEVSGDLRWVVHLGMSGRLRIAGAEDPLEPHTHFVARMDDGREVRFVDPRTFGFVAVWTPEEWATSTLRLLGRDAFDDLPSPEEMEAVFAGRMVPVKALLLDQRFVAGLGNIYADEVLALSSIHPLRPVGSLTAAEIRALHDAILPVLEAGIEHGGTSLDDMAYLLPDGRAGDNLSRLAVYGRTGLPCLRCGTPIERTVIAQRSSHFCPKCQR